jgi:hypothetical protein
VENSKKFGRLSHIKFPLVFCAKVYGIDDSDSDDLKDEINVFL